MRKNLPVTAQEYVLPDGTSLVSKTDLKGRITYGNPAFMESSGYTLHELMGAPHNLVRHPDMPEAAFADLWVTIQQGKPWKGHPPPRVGICTSRSHRLQHPSPIQA